MDGGPVEVSDMIEYLDITKQSVYNRVKKHSGFKIEGGFLSKINSD